MKLSEKENIEINYWRDSQWEGPGMFTANNFLVKSRELHVFDYKIKKYADRIGAPQNILELGAGQGWASSYLKRFVYPLASFTCTDISPYAVKSMTNWEAVFDVQLDRKVAAKSYELPFEEGEFDLIFCYAAAHHFVLLTETLMACKRILSPDGVIAFIYEPTCSKLFYKWHFNYVNNFNPRIPEDVFIPQQLLSLAAQVGLNGNHFYDAANPVIRSLSLGAYFLLLNKFSFFQKWLPSSSDFFFTHSNKLS